MSDPVTSALTAWVAKQLAETGASALRRRRLRDHDAAPVRAALIDAVTCGVDDALAEVFPDDEDQRAHKRALLLEHGTDDDLPLVDGTYPADLPDTVRAWVAWIESPPGDDGEPAAISTDHPFAAQVCVAILNRLRREALRGNGTLAPMWLEFKTETRFDETAEALEVVLPVITRSLFDAAASLETALGTPAADLTRRMNLERLIEDLEAVHRDYLTMFEAILEQTPDAWEQGTPHYEADVRAAVGVLRRLRIEYEPVRVRVQAVAAAYDRADLTLPERTFVSAVLAYFPTGELRPDEAGPWTSGTAVLDHLYRSLDGELGLELESLVNQTLTLHRQRWLQVCQAHAALQINGGEVG